MAFRILSPSRRLVARTAGMGCCRYSSSSNTRSISSSYKYKYLPSPPCSATDFNHHKPGVARLNHASFGAVPQPVVQVQDQFRQSWLEQPDEWYFSGQLHDQLRHSAAVASQVLVPPTTTPIPTDQVCLVENSTVAACSVAYRWRERIEPGDVVVYFNIAYKACIHILKEYCEKAAGAHLVELTIPFGIGGTTTKQDILDTIQSQLQDMADRGIRPKFAFLDHITSQPAILLPIQEIISLIREYGGDDNNSQNNTGGVEVCVDGAHVVGSVSHLDILELDCDFYFSNFHKWGFAPSTATVLWSRYLTEMKHPIISWAWGQGMAEESLFPGTRDFSAMMAVPAAVEYLQTWRSSSPLEGLTSPEYCHQNVLLAAAKLRNDWGSSSSSNDTSFQVDDDLVATQIMVPLPKELRVTDIPGQKSQQRGLRDILRDDYDIEAAVGNFGDQGAYLRLSFAVYNTHEDIQRLSDAVIDIIEKQ